MGSGCIRLCGTSQQNAARCWGIMGSGGRRPVAVLCLGLLLWMPGIYATPGRFRKKIKLVYLMPGKQSKVKGGSKGVKGGKDPVTGRTITTTIDGVTSTFKDDVVYEHLSGSPDTIADDIIRPLKSIPNGAPPAGNDYIQFQLGDDRIAVNTYFGGSSRAQNHENIARYLILGRNAYDKKTGKLTSITPEKVGGLTKSDSIPDAESGVIAKVTTPLKVTSEDLFSSNPLPLKTLAEYSHGSTVEIDTGGGLATIKAFEGGKYFFDGWQNNLFSPSLV